MQISTRGFVNSMCLSFHCKFIIFVLLCHLLVTESDCASVVKEDGIVYVVGIFSICENNKDRSIDHTALLYHLMLKDYISKCNVKNKFKPERIGTISFDVCNDTRILTNVITSLMLDPMYRLKINKTKNYYQCSSITCTQTSTIIAIFTYVSVELTSLAANLLITENIPVFSINENNKQKKNEIWPLFFPIQNSIDDSYAEREFFMHFGWESIALITLTDDQEQNYFNEIQQLYHVLVEKQNTMCVVKMVVEKSNKTAIIQLVYRLKQRSDLQVIYTKGNLRDTFAFLRAADKLRLYNRTLFVSTDVKRYIDRVPRKLLNGLFLTSNYLSVTKIFDKFKSNTNITLDPWFIKYQQYFMKPHQSNNITFQTFAKYNNLNLSSTIEFSMAFTGLMFNQFNQKTLKLDIRKIKIITKRYFNSYGFKLNINITGMINMSKSYIARNDILILRHDIPNILEWPNNQKLPPKVDCPKISCPSGYFTELSLTKSNSKEMEIKWNCRMCPADYIKFGNGYGKCKRCLGIYKSNNARTFCFDPNTNKYIRITDNSMIVVVPFTAFGVIFTLFAIFIFTYYKNTPMIKSSNYPISIFQLFIHFIAFLLTMLLFIGKPKFTSCLMRPFIIGLLLTTVHVIILAKTQFLLFAFQRKKHSGNQILQVKTFNTICGIIMVMTNVCVFVVAITLKHPLVTEYTNEKKLQRSIYCNTDTHIHIQVIYLIFMAVICIIQGLRARTLPENYSETNSIVIAMFFTIVILTVYFPIYLSQPNPYDKTIANMLLVILLNIIIVMIMYGYKLYIVLFCQHLNTKRIFQRNVRIHMQTINNNK